MPNARTSRSKRDWPKPAAWAITQNERLWTKFDSVADRSVIIEWSLGDDYRTETMEAGDFAVIRTHAGHTQDTRGHKKGVSNGQ
jgi:hypothetical protein